MEISTHTEVDIITWLQRKDKRAVEAIYAQYQSVLLGTILRIVKHESLAEDVLQESLVKIWRHGPSYDPTKGRLFTWLINICRNTAIDKTRTKSFKQTQNIQQPSDVVYSSDQENSYEVNTDKIGVVDWVGKLDQKYQEVIEVVYLQEYSHREAAEKLGIPLGTLKTRVRDAIKELRKWT